MDCADCETKPTRGMIMVIVVLLSQMNVTWIQLRYAHTRARHRTAWLLTVSYPCTLGHISARFGFLFPGFILVRGTTCESLLVCLRIHHRVMVDEDTIIVALLCEEEVRRQRRKQNQRRVWIHKIWRT
jgi:hypothetical protein